MMEYFIFIYFTQKFEWFFGRRVFKLLWLFLLSLYLVYLEVYSMHAFHTSRIWYIHVAGSLKAIGKFDTG